MHAAEKLAGAKYTASTATRCTIIRTYNQRDPFSQREERGRETAWQNQEHSAEIFVCFNLAVFKKKKRSILLFLRRGLCVLNHMNHCVL